jgi:hypothetical protein
MAIYRAADIGASLALLTPLIIPSRGTINDFFSLTLLKFGMAQKSGHTCEANACKFLFCLLLNLI